MELRCTVLHFYLNYIPVYLLFPVFELHWFPQGRLLPIKATPVLTSTLLDIFQREHNPMVLHFSR